jgi:hypothetical protein
MRWVEHVAGIEGRRGVYRFLVGKREGKRPLGRYRRRWENNSKIYFQELRLGPWSEFIWLRTGTGGGLL